MMTEFMHQLGAVWLELAPWLLLGAAVAGVLHVVLPRNFIHRHLGGRGGVLKAVLLGVPLPLCSCGVIPTGLSLQRDGASKGATVGFLISTPQTGVDSVLVSASFLGWPFAVFKLASAFVTGLVGGWLTNVAEPSSTSADAVPTPTPEIAPPAPMTWTARVQQALAHGVEMLQTIWGWLVIGVVSSALITTLVPPGTFASAQFGDALLTSLAVLAISVPLYVCATASVPIAAALVATGLPASAALVFLMAGPATNVATIGAIFRTLGRRTTAIYLGTIVIGSMGLGFAFDSVVQVSPSVGDHVHSDGFVAVASSIVLAGLVAWFAVADARRWLSQRFSARSRAAETVAIAVQGMTCHGCARKLESKLLTVDGVISANVSFEQARATVSGTVDRQALAHAVRAAGFSVAAE